MATVAARRLLVQTENPTKVQTFLRFMSRRLRRSILQWKYPWYWFTN